MMTVAVVGGGIVGASAAYHLHRHGARVLWILGAHAGQATAAGAGILPPDDHFAPHRQLQPLLKAARRYYPELCSLLEEDGQSNDYYTAVGSLQVARTPEEAQQIPKLVKALAARRDSGFGHIGAVEQLTGSEARRLVPELAQNVLCGCFAPAAARVRGKQLLDRLSAALLRRGVRPIDGVARAQTAQGRVQSLTVGAQTIVADRFLFATGSWTGQLARAVPLPTIIRPQRGQLLQLRRPQAPSVRPLPSVLSFQFNYALWLADGQILAGATRESNAGFEASNTCSAIHTLLGQTLTLLPGLGSCSLEGVRVGLRPVTADGLPLLGPIEGLGNAYVAAGHGSYGLEAGPVSGAIAAQLILGQPPTVDVAPLSCQRFATAAATADAAAT